MSRKIVDNIYTYAIMFIWRTNHMKDNKNERASRMVDLENISDNTLSDLADLFKVFSDSTRMRIMYKLFDGPVSVGDIAEDLDMSQSAISHQLRNLKENKLVKSEREGKSIKYSLLDEHVKLIIEIGLEHITE